MTFLVSGAQETFGCVRGENASVTNSTEQRGFTFRRNAAEISFFYTKSGTLFMEMTVEILDTYSLFFLQLLFIY
jgi:hypothetical protein